MVSMSTVAHSLGSMPLFTLVGWAWCAVASTWAAAIAPPSIVLMSGRPMRYDAPIDDDTNTSNMYCPPTLLGLTAFRARRRAMRLSWILAVSKPVFPIAQCMLPSLSVLKGTPELRRRMIPSTSSVTVPSLGLGIRPRGPSTRATFEANDMHEGVATARSKSRKPSLIFSTRSSVPTIHAPAFLAASAAGPVAKTAMRIFLPVPCGSTASPRSAWSALRGSILSRIAASTLSMNFLSDPRDTPSIDSASGV
mmetsp:Transcript_68437/g.111084  ORF Transcript_68437/g.111084 Transcript_68437/m.111084 type:complete len:251 (+) Transcript_68437:472-1224(+)